MSRFAKFESVPPVKAVYINPDMVITITNSMYRGVEIRTTDGLTTVVDGKLSEIVSVIEHCKDEA